MVKDNLTGLMEAFIMENSKKIIWKVMVNSYGEIKEFMMVCG